MAPKHVSKSTRFDRVKTRFPTKIFSEPALQLTMSMLHTLEPGQQFQLEMDIDYDNVCKDNKMVIDGDAML